MNGRTDRHTSFDDSIALRDKGTRLEETACNGLRRGGIEPNHHYTCNVRMSLHIVRGICRELRIGFCSRVHRAFQTSSLKLKPVPCQRHFCDIASGFRASTSLLNHLPFHLR